MLLYVKTFRCRKNKLDTIVLDVDCFDTIYSVKEQIQEKENLQWNEQILMYNGNILNNQYTLLNYQIRNDATIYLVVKLS